MFKTHPLCYQNFGSYPDLIKNSEKYINVHLNNFAVQIFGNGTVTVKQLSKHQSNYMDYQIQIDAQLIETKNNIQTTTHKSALFFRINFQKNPNSNESSNC